MQEKLTIAAAIAGMLIVYFGIAAWAWPFITPFESPLWRCWHCGVELVHRFPLCPRCNAPAQPPPKLHVARVQSL